MSVTDLSAPFTFLSLRVLIHYLFLNYDYSIKETHTQLPLSPNQRSPLAKQNQQHPFREGKSETQNANAQTRPQTKAINQRSLSTKNGGKVSKTVSQVQRTSNLDQKHHLTDRRKALWSSHPVSQKDRKQTEKRNSQMSLPIRSTQKKLPQAARARKPTGNDSFCWAREFLGDFVEG